MYFLRTPSLWILISLSSFVLQSKSTFSDPARFKKIHIVVLENTRWSDAARQPFLESLTKKGAFFAKFFAEARPSQPNYLALVGGSIFNVSKNAPVDLKETQITDLLEAKGKTWKTYAEDYPGGCFLGIAKGKYVRKHNPLISFQSIQQSPERCGRIVPASQLDEDIAQKKLPDFSLYIPDNDHNGHDTGVEKADQWLKQRYAPLLTQPDFMKDMLLVVTFDESHLEDSTNQIYTAFFGDSVRPGAVNLTRHDHYSLLKLVEEQWALGSLGRNDGNAPVIDGIWK